MVGDADVNSSARPRIQLCGDLSIELAGERVDEQLRGRQGRQLFAYLVANRTRVVSRDELVDAIWPIDPPAQAGAALSTLLSHVRRALGPDRLIGRSALQLALPPDAWIDIEAAGEAIGRAEAALAREEWQAAWSPAHVALSIAERGLLPGHDAPWIDVRRRDLDELMVEALECLATLGVRLGGSELAEAERAARRLIEVAPMRESGHVALMEIHAARDNAAEGLRVYGDLRERLRDELGAAPGASAQEIHMRLLEASAGQPTRPHVDGDHDEQPATRAATAVPLPTLVEAPQRASFVGRRRDLDRLLLALDRGSDVPRQLALVAGEPGIGKTRVLMQFGRVAHERGAEVLYGRADEDGLIPYGPFVEALRHHVAHTPAAAVRRAAELGGSELRVLLPGLVSSAADSEVPATPDAALARYRLFDAMSALLVDAAAERPIVLLLDDLHWADEPTLLLMKHILRAPDQRCLLVVGTYRDAELHRARAVLDALADLQRDVPVDRVHLRGLGPADVAALAREATGGEPDDGLIRSIHGDTDGNPFFVLELARHLTEAPDREDREALPESVRDVVLRRLGKLDSSTQAALRTGAALGREFDLDLLAQVCDLSGDALIDAIDEAVDARVVAPVPGRPDRYSFAHALTRTALYGELRPARRVRTHERIARTLEGLVEEGRPVAMAEVAAHMVAALPRIDVDAAIDYSTRAATEATDLLAYEDAADHLERVVALLAEHRAGESPKRTHMLLDLGRAQRCSGRGTDARATYGHAIDAARALADPELLARAVLGYGGGFFESAFVDETLVALLEEAIAGLADDDSALRVELLARLAKALYYSEDDERDAPRRELLTTQALAMAERLEQRPALLVALEGRHFALTRPENLEERIATARRIIDLAEECGDRDRALLGRCFLIADLIEAGDMGDAYRELEAYGRLAEESRLPHHRWYHARLRAMRALLEGRLGEVEGLSQHAFALGQPVEPRTATMHFGTQMWLLNYLRGTLSPLEEAVRGFAANYPRVPAWRAALAHLLLEQGEVEEATEIFREFRESRFGNIPRDAIWSVTTTVASDLVAAGLGDERDARVLYDMLEPFSHRNAVTGEVIFCSGPVALYAGAMALAMGDPDAAIPHLEDALVRCAEMGARPFEGRAAGTLADALRARHAPGDDARARELDALAEERAREVTGAPAGVPV